MTAHSPVGMLPEEFGVIPEMNDISFANNDIQFKDKTGINHDKFSFGLKKSLFNYMHGICFDYDLQDWFDFKIPKTKVPSDFIIRGLEQEESFSIKPSAKIIWLGTKPRTEIFSKYKKGNTWEMMRLVFHDRTESFEVTVEKEKGEWLLKIFDWLNVKNGKKVTFAQLIADYETQLNDFELFWYSKSIQTIRAFGLLAL